MGHAIIYYRRLLNTEFYFAEKQQQRMRQTGKQLETCVIAYTHTQITAVGLYTDIQGGPKSKPLSRIIIKSC